MKNRQLAFVISLLVLLLAANPQVFGQKGKAHSRRIETKRTTGRTGSGSTTSAASKTGGRLVTDPKQPRVLSGEDSTGKKKKLGSEPSPSLPKSPTPTPRPLPRPR